MWSESSLTLVLRKQHKHTHKNKHIQIQKAKYVSVYYTGTLCGRFNSIKNTG